ncbi:E3 ubiquitin-protein ligase ATL6-like [Curcuma longa]|uniref:E3 ubiquitin-protein ligase ATL6-like n=1 Tax=Curcuma longa TaxID=136217 RepID=UPI003D9EDC76
MATTRCHRRPTSTAGWGTIAANLFLLSLLMPVAPLSAAGRAPPPFDLDGQVADDNPSMITVVMISVSALLLLGILTVLIRQFVVMDESGAAVAESAVALREGLRGLSPEMIGVFPTMTYGEAKAIREGSDELECAVCISEFEEEEALRLLPGCCHVFHTECIDAWLADHVTCPVCRADLVAAAGDLIADDHDSPPSVAASTIISAPYLPADHEIVVEAASTASDTMAAPPDLARTESEEQDESTRPTTLPRSLSSKNSRARSEPTPSVDRYTLRLPEHVRRQIFAAASFPRSASCAVVFPSVGTSSSRPGGISRWMLSVRRGWSERWSPSFLRPLSMAFPPWKRSDSGESSGKKREADGSTRRRRFPSVRGSFDWLINGFGGRGSAASADDRGRP